MLVDDEVGGSTRKSHLFMLRFWLEDVGSGQVDWRAKVQYVNSGEVRYVRGWPALEEFVKRFLFEQDVREDCNNGKSGNEEGI